MNQHAIGYARVSTNDQDLTSQRDELTAAGCKRIFAEKATGKHAKRPELARMLDHLRAGDVVTVTRLDRLARSTRDLLDIAEQLEARGAGLRSLAEPWADTTTPAGRMVLTVFGGIAEFERSLIIERTRQGQKAAKARGVRFGRPTALSAAQVACARDLLSEGHTVAEAAELLNVHRSTLYRALERSEATTPAEAKRRGAFREDALSEADALAAVTTEKAKSDQDEPFFITKEIEAEMVKAGYSFDPPASHVRTVSLAGILSQMTDEELKDWPGDMAEQERERRNLAAKKHP